MKIAIIGGGASGIYSAILIKHSHPEYEVVVFDKEEKAERKMYATGNGHCNLLNAVLSPDYFNEPSFVGALLKRHPVSDLVSTLEGFGIELLKNDDLYYPLSYSASSYVSFLENLAKALHIVINLGDSIVDYSLDGKVYSLRYANGKVVSGFDKVVIATGGMSSPKLGSDGSFFKAVERHGYKINPLLPGLVPLKLEGNFRGLDGYRHKARAYLKDEEGKIVHQEDGELLYKDDGLSGIMMFNLESVYARLRNKGRYFIEVDLFPEYGETALRDLLNKDKKLNPSFYLDAYFPKTVQSRFISIYGNDDKLVKALKGERFLIKGTYPFTLSQVSIGGVKVDEVDPSTLESKREPGVYLVGEVLDVDGLCGGYNLSWALLSALAMSEHL
ncbi:MAG: aminoacetone oxidase family FAD-binding enzyme [Bacilli bacterium]|jgi:predicted Rossmann fold flavoprotein|nr:aminoacetone oxidase family FAD-binding enzyme [Bacilli bacterium]MCH4210211.1 aminoacetone oxidase family FAD-binding enzyme [Bacilli bacterium]MCH4228152.1 aminoacetone oxidase family FAD-binding enzyme [Bacilli bacterium]MCH4278138.1 aminoacetone oxidase family FAD-binding enzyme [Bacilli bacterium]MCI2054542.1 aminoacetone oxidase family FAD-binding enzyme [Bacilli bacterium]